MKAWRLISLAAAGAMNCAYAAPLVAGSATALSRSAISSYTPYTHFASAGYCNPKVIKTWGCGANCNALPGFKTVASGGDGITVQYWFVGYYPPLSSVIVVHQGTDPANVIPLVYDGDIIRESLDPVLFPNVPDSVGVHDGFKALHASTAATVLAAVKTAINTYGATKVTLTAHSLGGALALLDSIYLPLHLPSNIQFKTVLYGLPRVGNQAFADYVDAHVKDLTRINNKHDPVPILPGRFLGYRHPKGEVHIKDDSSWVVCSGQEDLSPGCTVTDVGNIFIGNTKDHDGPYDGILTSC